VKPPLGEVGIVDVTHAETEHGITTSLADLLGEGATRTFSKKSLLISEGDPGSAMYLILTGRVKVYTGDDNGKELVLDYCGPGEIIGEMAMDGGPRCASVVAEELTRCALIPLASLRERLKTDPGMALEIIDLLIQRARIATRRAKELALANVYNRVTRLLCELADSDAQGHLVVREPISQKNIADRVGSSRDMVNRVFKELTKGGYLAVDGRNITILKKLPAEW
jgi:CRP/FNR family cyclic AMP-dependent transcriptional regulator